MSEIPLETREQIVQEIAAGNKLRAIKLYREASGADLSSAKKFVEQLQVAVASGSADGGSDASFSVPGMSDELVSEIVELLRRGDKIPAIKVYRDAIPCSLKEAKDAVEQIERDHNIPKARSGCGAAALLCCLASVWLVLWCR